MFGIFVHYSTRPIYDVGMNLFCWPPSVDIFNILPGFLWQPLLRTFVACRLIQLYQEHCRESGFEPIKKNQLLILQIKSNVLYKTTFPLALVGYEMIIANAHSWNNC